MLLYVGQVVKPMDEAIVENLSNLANLVWTYGSTLTIAEGLDAILITTVALILVLLAARIVKRKRGVQKSLRVRSTITGKRASGRLFERKGSPALKPCPNCAERLPLSTIICNMCGYNFLAERPGRGQKLLPFTESMTNEVPEQESRS